MGARAPPQDGIVFIDEIDKIVVSSDVRDGADASSAGVQVYPFRATL